jgi:hypothetical protein
MRSLILMAMLMVSGCCSVPQGAAEQLQSHWRLVGAAARKGITDDPRLDERSKANRLGSIDEFEALLMEVKDHAAR